MISKLKYIIPIAVIIGLSSCKKEFLDINTDPNNPVDAPVSLLLTGAEKALGDALAMGGGNNGGLSQILEVYVHQITTREEADQYGATANEFFLNLAWPKFYASTPPPGASAPLSGIFQNLEEIIRKAGTDGNPQYRGVAKVLKAYAYSQLVDVYGDIPFSEANKLADSVAPVIYPKFDDDAAIYPQLFTMLDEAIADLSTADADNLLLPAENDAIYQGDAGKWIKAANTIKLKLYTQVRKVQDVSAEVTALLSDPDQLIAENSESFLLPYGVNGATDDRNPAFQEYYSTQRSNHISPWFYEIMKGRNAGILNGNPDPRIPYYWYNQLRPASNPPTDMEDPTDWKGEAPENQTEYRDDAFATIYFGSVGADRDRNNQNSLSVIGLYPAGGRYDDGEGGGNTPTAGVDGNSGTGAAPYRFITYADRLYLEAELINVGLVTGDARAVLEKAILESFKQVDQVTDLAGPSQTVPALVNGETPTAEVQTYIDDALAEYDAGNISKKLEMIMTQKWISSFGSAVDAYTDIRRTGYPVIWDPNNPSMAPGGFAQPPPAGDVFRNPQRPVPVLLSKPFPASLPWVKSELDVNRNAPAQKDPATYKVFWMP